MTARPPSPPLLDRQPQRRTAEPEGVEHAAQYPAEFLDGADQAGQLLPPEAPAREILRLVEEPSDEAYRELRYPAFGD